MFFVVGQHSAGSVSNFSVIAGGYTDINVPSSALVSTVDKYNLSNDSVSAGTSLPAADASGDAVGTTEFGIFQAGAGPTHHKYTYASDAWSSSTALNTERYGTRAVGNETVGLFGGGYLLSNDSFSAVVDKFTFSSEAVVAGTSLSAVKAENGAAGSPTIGVFAEGMTSGSTRVATTYRYTYSSDAVASGASAPTSRSWVAASGTTTAGYWSGGHSGGFFGAESRVDKYTYASDTWATAGQLFGAVGEEGYYHHCSTSNPTIAINTAGQFNNSAFTANTYRYTFSAETTAGGTALSQSRGYAMAVSANPGNFA